MRTTHRPTHRPNHRPLHRRGDTALLGVSVAVAPLLVLLYACTPADDTHRGNPTWHVPPVIQSADAARHQRTMVLCDDTVSLYMQDQLLGDGQRVALTDRAGAQPPNDVDSRVADAITHGLYSPGLAAGNLEPRYELVISACKRAGWTAH